MQKITIILIPLFVSMLAGCAAVVVGATATTLHDRRSTGAVIDDQTIEFKLSSQLRSDEVIGEKQHIRPVSFNGTLLLAGEVLTDQGKSRAVDLASDIPGVKRVVNELVVSKLSSLARRSKDTYITAKIKTSMLKIELEGFDPSRIKVLTLSATVYLMGIVNQEEASVVVEHVRRLRGIRKVVKVFEYLD